MSGESSFDIVSTVNIQEIDNAANQAIKEIANRFDFKGSKTQIFLDKTNKEITIISDDDYRLKNVIDIVQSKLIKRGISIKALDFGKIEPSANMTVRQLIKLKEGIEQAKAKEIIKTIKETGLKITAQIQGEKIRVSGRSKDNLQSIIQLLRTKDISVPLQFINFK